MMELELHGVYKCNDAIWFEVIEQCNTEEGIMYTCKTIYSLWNNYKAGDEFTLLAIHLTSGVGIVKSSVSEVTLKLIKEYGKPDEIERYLKCQKTKSN